MSEPIIDIPALMKALVSGDPQAATLLSAIGPLVTPPKPEPTDPWDRLLWMWDVDEYEGVPMRAMVEAWNLAIEAAVDYLGHAGEHYDSDVRLILRNKARDLRAALKRPTTEEGT